MNWLLLRGLGRVKEHWHLFPSKLESLDSTETILTLNLPGIDDSSENTPWSIAEITEQVRLKWLKQKTKGDWGVIAISLGGMVAIDWCHRYPDDFKKCVSINSSSRSSSLFRRLLPYAMLTILKAITTRNLRKREAIILELTTSLQTIDKPLLDKWEEILNDKKLHKVFCSQIFAASRFNLPEKLSTPTLFLAAKNDQLAHYTCSEDLAVHFDKPICLHPTAGHDLPLDDPDWIVEQIRSNF